MMAISSLFQISIDELLSNEKIIRQSSEYLFESVTEYDIDSVKHYDMKLGGAKTKYVGKIELNVNAKNIEVRSLNCESIEFDTKTKNVILDDVIGTVEFNCNLDMNIVCNSLNGSVELNQVSATSRIRLPEGVDFAAVAKGIKTSIFYERDGRKTECFASEDSKNKIKLNGIKSELVICR